MDQRNETVTQPMNFSSDDWELHKVANGFVLLPKERPQPRVQQNLIVSTTPTVQTQSNQIQGNGEAYSNALTLHYALQNTRKPRARLQPSSSGSFFFNN